MTLKIKLFKYKLKATIGDDIAKTVAYFKKHGIDITFEIQDTNVIKSDAVLKLMMPNDGKCDIVMYMYEKNLFSAPTFGLAFSVSKTLQGIYLASDIVQDGVDYTFKSICHEIMHTLFYKFGAWALDPMDSMLVGGVMKPYYKNEDLDATDGNFAEAFKRLAPFLDVIPKVTITRKSDDGIQTLGKLTYGDFWCDTLERPYKDNKPNISAIPKGTYKCVWSFSPKFLKYTYEVQGVKGRSGIRLHSGNYFFDIQGCILLGMTYKDINKDGKLDILNSRIIIKQFEEKMGKKPFLLQIV